jgi:hypothetical protein
LGSSVGLGVGFILNSVKSGLQGLVFMLNFAEFSLELW